MTHERMTEREAIALTSITRRILGLEVLGDGRADGTCVCVGCGCTTENACLGGCSWIVQDLEEGIGICSKCVTLPIDELVERNRKVLSI